MSRTPSLSTMPQPVRLNPGSMPIMRLDLCPMPNPPARAGLTAAAKLSSHGIALRANAPADETGCRPNRYHLPVLDCKIGGPHIGYCGVPAADSRRISFHGKEAAPCACGVRAAMNIFTATEITAGADLSRPPHKKTICHG